MVKAFTILGPWLAWKVGSELKVRAGDNPWIGCCEVFDRFTFRKNDMNGEKDNKSLAEASIQAAQGVWLQYWKSVVGLKLQGDLATEWLPYVSLLKRSAIFIKETDDELKWSWNKANGVLTAKI